MRICRFGEDRIGVVVDDEVRDVTAVIDELPAAKYPLPGYDPFISRLDELRPVIERHAASASPVKLSEVSLLAPVANPGKIVAAPVNYLKHLEEAREDSQIHHQNQIGEIQRVGLFLKATSSLIGPSRSVLIRHPERRNDHEIELVAVIGRKADRVPASRALDYVAGYSIGLDMTARGPEERSFRKSIDTYSVLGPWLVTADEIPNPGDLQLKLTVDGKVRQEANTRDLVIGVAELIEFASSFYTLMPGDLLFTGTPEGVGPVVPGNVIKASIAGIGELQVQVGSPSAP